MAELVWVDAVNTDAIAEVRSLFFEYGADVSRSYCLKGFDAEVAGLPGAYAPPSGGLLLLRTDDVAAGCVAFRPLEPGIAEIKRLYVRPAYQGRGFGRQLTQAAMDRACAAGHRTLRLDTLGHMAAAQGLYRAMGFREIPACHDDTARGMHFMEVLL